MIRLIPTLFTAGILASGAAMAQETMNTEESFSFEVSAGTEVVISTINGFIEAEEYGGSQFEVSYEIVCDDTEEMEAIEVVHDTSDGIIFEVNYPSDWHGSTDAVVDFVLRLPASTGLEMALQTVSGDVILEGGTGYTEINVVSGSADVDGYAGELHVNLVSGDIILSNTPCLGTASLVNGSIVGDFDALECDADFSAVDGTVILSLPGDARVFVSTLSGEISVPGGEVVHEMVGSSAEYGEGDVRIDVSTVSADVEITD